MKFSDSKFASGILAKHPRFIGDYKRPLQFILNAAPSVDANYLYFRCREGRVDIFKQLVRWELDI